MIKRELQSELIKLSKQFKAIAVVGPRQSGKTTLTRHLFKDKPYVNLENPDSRRFAVEDPRGFLSQYKEGAVIDEAQRAPELFSYLQQVLDDDKRKGRFILTGSNNFLLQENISQSLAGRIAYINLLPFTVSELSVDSKTEINKYILSGSYPPVHDQKIDAGIWYQNYIRTYIERDVRQLKNVNDLIVFDRFLKLCAGRTGQLLNMSNLALETGIDSKTALAWLSVLESSFIVFRLFSYHRSFNKRIVKMPKLYFYDTGLICSLLGIRNEDQLAYHPLFGSIFENLVISEILKTAGNRTKGESLYFWRDNAGHEIDLLIEQGNRIIPVEIKSGKTINHEYFKGVNYWKKISGTDTGTVIYSGDQSHNYSDGNRILPWFRSSYLFGS
jgi:uncharacterized protein